VPLLKTYISEYTFVGLHQSSSLNVNSAPNDCHLANPDKLDFNKIYEYFSSSQYVHQWKTYRFSVTGIINSPHRQVNNPLGGLEDKIKHNLEIFALQLIYIGLLTYFKGYLSFALIYLLPALLFLMGMGHIWTDFENSEITNKFEHNRTLFNKYFEWFNYVRIGLSHTPEANFTGDANRSFKLVTTTFISIVEQFLSIPVQRNETRWIAISTKNIQFWLGSGVTLGALYFALSLITLNMSYRGHSNKTIKLIDLPDKVENV